MRAVIQRVSGARVTVEGEVTGEVGEGLLVFLGVEGADTGEDAAWLAGKVARMRIFDDGEGRMNRSLLDAGGRVLLVSQFTLHASTRKGNRPSFIRAAEPGRAEELYEAVARELEALTGRRTETGRFGARMEVELLNDGPVTIVIDSRARE